MKTGLLATLGLIALATTVQAQNNTAFNWEGAYVGAFAGASSFEVESSDLTDTFTNDAPPIGEIILNYGINGGYNWMPFDDNLLLGLEVDVQGGNSTSQLIKFNEDGTDGQLYENEITSLATLRGRAGVVNGNVLTYLTGGLAFAQVDYLIVDLDEAINTRDCSVNGIICADNKDSLLGLNVGLGIEYAFRENATARFEIMHYNLEPTSTELFNGEAVPICSKQNADECSAYFKSGVTQLRFGVNYKF